MRTAPEIAAAKRAMTKPKTEREEVVENVAEAIHDELRAAMTEKRHTPGPWEPGCGWPATIYAACVPIAHTCNGNGYDWLPGCRFLNDDVAKANAKLMAAAPELLAACWTALHRLVNLQGECSGCAAVAGMELCAKCKLKAAIAKASRAGRGE